MTQQQKPQGPRASRFISRFTSILSKKTSPLSNKRRLKEAGKTKTSLKKEEARRSRRGQGLIEYLILTALMGVAAIAIIRSLNQTVKSRFANVIYALQGKSQKAKTHSIKKEEYQRSDLSNFMSGAANKKKEKK